jgi:hypothetical protein
LRELQRTLFGVIVAFTIERWIRRLLVNLYGRPMDAIGSPSSVATVQSRM